MQIPFPAFILQGIPEGIAIVLLSFIIAKIPLNWKKILIIGLIIATSSYVMRLLPVTFGIHTVVIIGLEFILLFKVGKGKVNSALIAAIISSIAIIIVETVCLSILMPLFNVTSETLFNNTLIRILLTLPQVFVIFLISFIILKIRTGKRKV